MTSNPVGIPEDGRTEETLLNELTSTLHALRRDRDHYQACWFAVPDLRVENERLRAERDKLHKQLLEHAEVCCESAYPVSDRVTVETSDRIDWKARAEAAEGILNHNMALANATTRKVMEERNAIIRKLRERYSAIEIAEQVGLTRQRVHQILNEAPITPVEPEQPLTVLRDCWSCGTGMDLDQKPEKCLACGADDPCGDGRPAEKATETLGEELARKSTFKAEKAAAPPKPIRYAHTIGGMLPHPEGAWLRYSENGTPPR